MMLQTADMEIATGMTPQGQLFVRTTYEGRSLIRTTRDVNHFLKMLYEIPDKRGEHPYTCSCCQRGFGPGHGALIVKPDVATTGVYACAACLADHAHFAYLHAMGCTPEMILLFNDRMEWL